MGSVIGAVTGGLFGEAEQPSQSQQFAGYNAWPEFAKTGYEDYFTRGQGVADTKEPFAPAPINQYEQAYLNMISGINNNAPALNQRGYGGFTAGEEAGAFDFGKRSSQQFRAAADLFGMVPQYYQRAGDATAMGIDPITGQQITDARSMFMNPYLDKVVGSTQTAMQDLLDRSQAAARARAGGALGNTRVGIEQGTIATEGAKRLGEVVGGLEYTGFTDANNSAMDLLTGNRERALMGAGQYSGIGSGLTHAGSAQGNLAAQLMNARGSIQNIRNAAEGRQMGAGGFIRGIEQGESQIPLQQLALLQSLFSPLAGTSMGTATGGTEATEGIFSSGGNSIAGLGNMFF